MNNQWQSFSSAEVLAKTESTRQGLDLSEAVARLRKYGANILPSPKSLSQIKIFLSQLNSPLVYIVLGLILVSVYLRHYTDAVFILIVVLINTLVGFYQESKANQSLAILKKLVKVRARVWRDGNEKEIDAQELVIGDVVTLLAGDKVPADGYLLEAKGLKVNESTLTGEWLAVSKEPGRLPENTAVADCTNLVFMGTVVEEGWAKMIVVATGLETEMGSIVSSLQETKERATPLQRKIKHLSKIVGAFILAVIFLIVAVGYLREKTFTDIFVSALALAVSAIPEGLLPAITVVLALGMRRILQKGGLVRKLAATESLGSVTVICTDKTGTLTEGKMQVSHILTGKTELMNDGKNGLLEKNSGGAPSSLLALKIAALANDAYIENPEAELQEWIVRGRPTERALLLTAVQSGLNKIELEARYPLIDRMNFNTELKYAAALHQSDKHKNILFVMGAPEKIIGCSSYLDIDGKEEKIGPAQMRFLTEGLEKFTSKGLRVLACAYRHYPGSLKYKNLNELVSGLTLVGLIALKDPLRAEAKEAIMAAKKAGIRTIIVTGDHKLTAKAVAEEIGLDIQELYILEGKELDSISEERLRELVKDIVIFARVSPRHKLSIVKALQANDEIVAMFGDGINDSPALKAADVGVAVGSGTDVAKEVADLVLLDDNFQIIVKAIEQGRIIFANIRKIFIYLVADDFSELVLFFGCMAFNLPVPLLPAQILWINIVEDGLPSIALTTEQEAKGIMEEKPCQPKESILSRPFKLWMSAILIITGLAAFLFFFATFKLTDDLFKSRAMVFALMCLDSLIFAFCVRSFRQTIFRKDIFSNHYLVWATLAGLALLLGGIYFPPLQSLLSTSALGLTEWLIIGAISIVEILLIEFSKKKIFSQKP